MRTSLNILGKSIIDLDQQILVKISKTGYFIVVIPSAMEVIVDYITIISALTSILSRLVVLQL